ncbi:MAG: hypothetical protein ACXVB1_05650, partial [Pseudobdellovibrionaceae bacterium]
MMPWNGQKILKYVRGTGMCILISFAYQNCTKTKFLVDPIAKSEALGKENVFGTQATNDGGVRSTPGNDGSISGPQPGNDGGISGIGPGDDGSTPG